MTKQSRRTATTRWRYSTPGCYSCTKCGLDVCSRHIREERYCDHCLVHLYGEDSGVSVFDEPEWLEYGQRVLEDTLATLS